MMCKAGVCIQIFILIIADDEFVRRDLQQNKTYFILHFFSLRNVPI